MHSKLRLQKRYLFPTLDIWVELFPVHCLWAHGVVKHMVTERGLASNIV